MTESSPLAVAVADLTRTFVRNRSRLPGRLKRRPAESRTALDAITLTVPSGEVHGLLGPNGAGKTTLCKILSTVLIPTSGIAKVFGHDVVVSTTRVRPLVGVVLGGERGLYTRLTARQNLMYWSALYRQPTSEGAERTAKLLERLGLEERADERVETFSRGMKQRLHLARGLVGNPRLLILDEPTVGLDPAAARDFRGLVRQLRAEGRTILLTTHDMTEAEELCDRVTLIDSGKLLGTEDPRTIGEWLSAWERVTAEGVPAELIDRIRKVEGVAGVEIDSEGRITVETAGDGTSAAVLSLLVDGGVTSLSTSRPSLEEVYLHLIGSRGLNVG